METYGGERPDETAGETIDDLPINEVLYFEDRIRLMKKALGSERKRQTRLKARGERFYKSGKCYANSYKKIVRSRAVRAWMEMRRLLGKPYQPYDGKFLPRNCLESVAISDRNTCLVSDIQEFAAYVRESNGAAYYPSVDFKIGVMTDEFMYNYYKDSCDVRIVTSKNYKSVINEGLDLLIYISCWRGVERRSDGSLVEGKSYYGGEGRGNAVRVFRYAKSKGIPTVFQSIEDPPHYRTFLGIAKEADVVLTSAGELVPQYIKDTGNARCSSFLYGINPLYHNPIGMMRKFQEGSPIFHGDVLFAGSWYEKYKTRCEDTERVFDGVISYRPSALHVIDRFLYTFHDIYPFPAKYAPFIVPPIRHDILQKAHKAFDWTVNLNSVVDSETMCAMRVFEVQALGGLLLSNYALSVSNAFPGVFIVLDSDEVPRILGGYSEREIANMQIEGVRRLYRDATVYDRLNEMFEMAGVDCRFPARAVYVVGDASDPRVAASIAAQTLEGAVLVDRAEAADRLAGADGFVAMWGDGFSNEHHLEDMVNAFKFTDVGYVCYVPEERWGESYDYIEGAVAPDDALFDLSKVSIADVLAGGVDGLQGFGVLAPLWGRDTSGTEKDLAVIIPVYNNGAFLSTRCFRSLLRSSVFDRMRVYLVDDGSTDGETQQVVRALERDFDNVVAYLYEDGGSGSASRPRNKGLEMSSEPYVTFLDPDNEAVGDGYARLMEIMESEDVDLAFGTVPMVSPDGRRVRSFGEFGLIDDPREAVVRSRFFAQSMQGGIARRELLDRGAVRFAPGIGQDTLFFYELMAHARRAYSADIPVHVYFAERANSAVNAVTPSFFRRSLECERATAEFLEREGLMDEFRRLRLDDLMRGWYGAKLGAARLRDVPECAALVAEIGSLYGWEE